MNKIAVQLPLFDMPENTEVPPRQAPLPALVHATLATWMSGIANGMPVTPESVTNMIGDFTTLLIDEMDERARRRVAEASALAEVEDALAGLVADTAYDYVEDAIARKDGLAHALDIVRAKRATLEGP